MRADPGIVIITVPAAAVPNSGISAIAIAITGFVAGKAGISNIGAAVFIHPIATDLRRSGIDARIVVIAVRPAFYTIAISVRTAEITTKTVVIMAITAEIDHKGVQVTILEDRATAGLANQVILGMTILHGSKVRAVAGGMTGIAPGVLGCAKTLDFLWKSIAIFIKVRAQPP